MTETDAIAKANREPMPVTFIPYLQKYRVYQLFKDMVADLVLTLPQDHLKHMKIYLSRLSNKDTDRILLLVSPRLRCDVTKIVKELFKDLGMFVITRRCILDKYEMEDDPCPGCISPVGMAKVTKTMVSSEPVIMAGWIMFDHPCTVREARCLQADGVLPTVTLVLVPTPSESPEEHDPNTSSRSFFDQDFEGLRFAYKATAKDVYITSEDEIPKIVEKCINAVRATRSGMQGPGQGYYSANGPGVFRVLLIGPRGSGLKTQAGMLSQNLEIVYVDFWELYQAAKDGKDEVGESLRRYGPSSHTKIEIVKRRLLKKDCIEQGWVLVGYPTTAKDYDNLDTIPTPPNRVIFLNVDMATCKQRAMAQAVDWCTGQRPPQGSLTRLVVPPRYTEAQIDYDLDYYFSEAVAELRAAAGLTAVEINADKGTIEKIQIKLQAAVMGAPTRDIVSHQHLPSNVNAK